MQHFEAHAILNDNQRGFRQGRSFESQLLEFIEELTTNLESGQQTGILIMDFAKAFDLVNHSLLIHKLQHYGKLQGSTLTWINRFLKDRCQAVIPTLHRWPTRQFPKSLRAACPAGCDQVLQNWKIHNYKLLDCLFVLKVFEKPWPSELALYFLVSAVNISNGKRATGCFSNSNFKNKFLIRQRMKSKL